VRRFLEQTLIPLNEAVHEAVVRGDMQNFQELRFTDMALRILRDVTRLVRPPRDARQILLATPPNDPNELGLAILELLLFTEGVNCLTLGAGVPAQEIVGAAEAYHATLDGAPLELTRTEFELLHFLLRYPGRVFSRSYLLDAVWGEYYVAGDRSVDNAILRLRKKLGSLGEAIETVWGGGYRLLPE
jgi:hypothetical protein